MISGLGKAGENGRENPLGPGAPWCRAEMSVAARNVSTDNRRGMSGGTETQTTWAVREVPAGPLTRQGVPMAANSRSSSERAGDRDKALETALLQIERQFGKGSVMRLGEETRVPVEVIPTGSIALDVALGLGGLPRGRIVEIYGPESSGKTTVALHAVANAQKAGGIAAFIDAEHALDPEYAQKLGVDTDALLVSQPDTGEQALEIADMLIRSGALDVIVIDSVAALVPKAEIEGEMGDSHVGLQARLMSQALRKITGALNQTKTTAIFINQLREKVGVMFGCMSYSTRVTLADGTQEKIGKIVNQRMDVEVLSYDPETDKMVPRRIVNWFNNGKAEQFLQFSVAKSGKNGLAQFAATENHLIRTPGGWRQAGELIPGDRVMVAEQQRLSEQQLQLILGSLMGDGNLSPNRKGRSGTRFRMGHGARQAAYLDWKASLLGNIPHSRTVNAKGAVFADFTPLPELGELHEAVYFGDGKKHLSWDYLKSLTPLALAVWYMDDGGFTLRSKGVQERTAGGTGRIEICVEAMSPGSRDRLARYLRDTYGLRRQAPVPRGAEGERASIQHCGVGKVPEARRAVCAPVDGVQAATAVPRRVQREAGIRADDATYGSGADPGHPRQAADPVHEPLRYRGGRISQLLRRRGDGAQQS